MIRIKLLAMKISSLVLVLCSLQGCGIFPATTDVTARFSSPQGYEPGSLFELREGVYIEASTLLVPQDRIDPPPTFNAVAEHPERWVGFSGVLKKGNLIRFIGIIHGTSINDDIIIINGMVQTGVNKGKVVDMYYLSIVNGGHRNGGYRFSEIHSIQPDPRYLRRIRPDQKP